MIELVILKFRKKLFFTPMVLDISKASVEFSYIVNITYYEIWEFFKIKDEQNFNQYKKS